MVLHKIYLPVNLLNAVGFYLYIPTSDVHNNTLIVSFDLQVTMQVLWRHQCLLGVH